MSLIEIKDLNVLIDSKPFFDQPVKNKQEANKKLLKYPDTMAIQQETLLDYSYCQNC